MTLIRWNRSRRCAALHRYGDANATHLGRLKLAHARCRLIVSLEQPSQCVELALSLAIAPHRHRCPTIPDQSIGRTSLPCPERSVIVSGGSTASPLKIDVAHRAPDRKSTRLNSSHVSNS